MIMPTAGGSFTRDEVRENPIETNSMMGLYTNHCNLLNLSAIAIPENSTDKNLPFGITIFGLSDSENLVIEAADKFLDSEYIEFAVCGLHKKGYPLEYQLSELGAEFLRHLRNGSLNDCRFSSVAFESCDLVEADFSHAPLRGIDLRTSRISGITLNISDLKGAVITSLQAMDLLPLLGVIIED